MEEKGNDLLVPDDKRIELKKLLTLMPKIDQIIAYFLRIDFFLPTDIFETLSKALLDARSHKKRSNQENNAIFNPSRFISSFCFSFE